MTTSGLLATAWNWNLATVCTLLLGAAGIGIAVRRQRCQGRKTGLWLVAFALFVLSVASPLATLSRGFLFSAHMAQHLMLLLLVPLLVTLALNSPRQPNGESRLSRPLTAVGWSAGVGAMWLWHEPNLCSLSVTSPVGQAGQIVSLLFAGYLFWRPVWGAIPQRLDPGAVVVYLFSACLACTALGIYVTFVPVSVCPVFAHPPADAAITQLVRGSWGFTAAVDQQLGGLLMWVPACTIYLVSILAQFGRGYRLEPFKALTVGSPK